LPKSSTKITERKIADLIPKKLALIKRSWSLKDGSTTTVYRARLWQPKVKRYTVITLDASNESAASQEAVMVFAKHSQDIEQGRDIGSVHRKLDHFISQFLEFQTARANDGQITSKRVDVLRHSLASLVRFYEEEKRPTLDELARLYSSKWNLFRSGDKVKITGKPLTVRFRNNEINVHKMFFRWCVDMRYSSVVPTLETLKVQRTNAPFPKEYYQKLLAVSRKEVQEAKSSRHRWELMNLRYVILLMSGIGCRVTETRQLRWSDISTRGDKSFIYLRGKDKERTIRLPDRVYGHLQDLRKFKESLCDDYVPENFPYVFNSWKSKTPAAFYDGGIRKRWMEKTGLENYRNYELVCFRHKFITEALNSGAHSLTIAKYCGTSVSMIEKTYEGLVDTQIYDLVFKNVPDDALTRNETPQWLEQFSAQEE